MTLDSEQDRNILLELIARASIQGSAAAVIADLTKRIANAEIGEPAPPVYNEVDRRE